MPVGAVRATEGAGAGARLGLTPLFLQTVSAAACRGSKNGTSES